jgi:hypothetical protein
MMKKILLILPAALVLYFSAWAQNTAASTPDDAALEVFGRSFVAALAQKDIAALKPLMINEVDARNTLAQTDMTPEQQDKEIEALYKAMPNMLTNFEHAHSLCWATHGERGLWNMEYVKTARQRESNHPVIEKTDLLIYIKMNGGDMVIDVDDCVRTVNGWRFTAKFGIKRLDEQRGGMD